MAVDDVDPSKTAQSSTVWAPSLPSLGGEWWSEDDDKGKDEVCLLRSNLAVPTQDQLSRDPVPLARLTSSLTDLMLTIDSVDA